jgi:hypothetical protein
MTLRVHHTLNRREAGAGLVGQQSVLGEFEPDDLVPDDLAQPLPDDHCVWALIHRCIGPDERFQSAMENCHHEVHWGCFMDSEVIVEDYESRLVDAWTGN